MKQKKQKFTHLANSLRFLMNLGWWICLFFLEPKWPLFGLEKTFLLEAKQRTNGFQVCFSGAKKKISAGHPFCKRQRSYYSTNIPPAYCIRNAQLAAGVTISPSFREARLAPEATVAVTWFFWITMVIIQEIEPTGPTFHGPRKNLSI